MSTPKAEKATQPRNPASVPAIASSKKKNRKKRGQSQASAQRALTEINNNNVAHNATLPKVAADVMAKPKPNQSAVTNPKPKQQRQQQRQRQQRQRQQQQKQKSNPKQNPNKSQPTSHNQPQTQAQPQSQSPKAEKQTPTPNQGPAKKNKKKKKKGPIPVVQPVGKPLAHPAAKSPAQQQRSKPKAKPAVQPTAPSPAPPAPAPAQKQPTSLPPPHHQLPARPPDPVQAWPSTRRGRRRSKKTANAPAAGPPQAAKIDKPVAMQRVEAKPAGTTPHLVDALLRELEALSTGLNNAQAAHAEAARANAAPDNATALQEAQMPLITRQTLQGDAESSREIQQGITSNHESSDLLMPIIIDSDDDERIEIDLISSSDFEFDTTAVRTDNHVVHEAEAEPEQQPPQEPQLSDINVPGDDTAGQPKYNRWDRRRLVRIENLKVKQRKSRGLSLDAPETEEMRRELDLLVSRLDMKTSNKAQQAKGGAQGKNTNGNGKIAKAPKIKGFAKGKGKGKGGKKTKGTNRKAKA